MWKPQRIRDPLHDLIQFSGNDLELERVLWKVLQSRPFQRLRRIKQLGFSELVYPGASHSRFAHSIGVFHTARRLMQVVRRYAEPSQSKENLALAAALVHDLGHGPFSHAFEEVGRELDLELANHEKMSQRIILETEVGEILRDLGGGFASDVADIIREGGVKSVQHAVVSSQFDADRLDYMRRDRMMTGTQHAAIDFHWLIENLEIASVQYGVDDEQLGEIETFVLGPKALYAAEAFVLGLFQLYPTVYFHKTTRGAEKLFARLMIRVVNLVREGSVIKTGLPEQHPLVKFAKTPGDIEVALNLDDTAVWGGLCQLADSEDPQICEFAKRLRDRKLYKCKDIRQDVTTQLNPRGHADEEFTERIDRCCARIEDKLKNDPIILIDRAKREPYKTIEKNASGQLNRINIRLPDNSLADLKECSNLVATLTTFKLLRAYYPDGNSNARDRITETMNQELTNERSS